MKLPALPFSTLKDGFTRFPVAAFEHLFRHLVHTLSWIEIEEINALGHLCLVDGSLFRVLVHMQSVMIQSSNTRLSRPS